MAKSKLGLKTVFLLNSNKRVPVPIPPESEECITADYFWIFNHENEDSLHNKKASFTIKSKRNYKTFDKKITEINSILLHSTCKRTSIYKF